MKTTSRKRRPQTEIFKAWLYYNSQERNRISFADFRKEVWPEWISIYSYPVYIP